MAHRPPTRATILCRNYDYTSFTRGRIAVRRKIITRAVTSCSNTLCSYHSHLITPSTFPSTESRAGVLERPSLRQCFSSSSLTKQEACVTASNATQDHDRDSPTDLGQEHHAHNIEEPYNIAALPHITCVDNLGVTRDAYVVQVEDIFSKRQLHSYVNKATLRRKTWVVLEVPAHISSGPLSLRAVSGGPSHYLRITGSTWGAFTPELRQVIVDTILQDDSLIDRLNDPQLQVFEESIAAKLLAFAGNNAVITLPDIWLTHSDQGTDGYASIDSLSTFSISNKDFSIDTIRVSLESLSFDARRRSIAKAILQYCRQLRDRLQSRPHPFGMSLRVPAEFREAKLFADQFCDLLGLPRQILLPKSSHHIQNVWYTVAMQPSSKEYPIFQNSWPTQAQASILCHAQVLRKLMPHMQTLCESKDTDSRLKDNFSCFKALVTEYDLSFRQRDTPRDVSLTSMSSPATRNNDAAPGNNVAKTGGPGHLDRVMQSPVLGYADHMKDIRSKESNASRTVDEVYSIDVSSAVLSAMTNTMKLLRDLEFPKDHEWKSTDILRRSGPRDTHHDYHPRYVNSTLRRRYAAIAKKYSGASPATSSTDRHQQLPIQDGDTPRRIRDAIYHNDITLIDATTGSGKTTQIPQIVFDHYVSRGIGTACRIACTQPRRLAATMVATRVARERLQDLGADVGHRVRFSNRPTEFKAGINYMTGGSFLRMMEEDPDWVLRRFTHIFLDEVHVRDLDTDLMLLMLKKATQSRRRLGTAMPKIILMSATLQTNDLEEYCRSFASDIKVETITVPGVTFPIRTQALSDTVAELGMSTSSAAAQTLASRETKDYLATQDSSLPLELRVRPAFDRLAARLRNALLTELPIAFIANVIAHVLAGSRTGDILVFLPGMEPIRNVDMELRKIAESYGLNMDDTDKYQLFWLHSMLFETNENVMNNIPMGCRRIILATNIAETSVTLPDVTYVIDSGISRLLYHDHSSDSAALGPVWISKAEAAQRRGRCGRTHSGTYIPLYSTEQRAMFDDAAVPELIRADLLATVLRCHSSPAYAPEPDTQDESMSDNTVRDDTVPRAVAALSFAPNPPDPTDVVSASGKLLRMHALDRRGQVTALGQVICRLVLSPELGRAAVLGLLFRCTTPVLTMLSISDEHPLLDSPDGRSSNKNLKKEFALDLDDDHAANIQAIQSVRSAILQNDHKKLSALYDQGISRHSSRLALFAFRQLWITLRSIYHRASYQGSHDEIHDIREITAVVDDIPPVADTHSGSNELLKAMSVLASSYRLAAWTGERWITPHGLTQPHYTSLNSLKNKTGTGIPQNSRRLHGDVIAYRANAFTEHASMPLLEGTTIVPALTAMLFCETLQVLGDEIHINGWLKYKIENPDIPSEKAAKIVSEYRKVIHRFIGLACDDLSLHPTSSVDPLANKFFGDNHRWTQIILDSVVKILDRNAADRIPAIQEKREKLEAIKAWREAIATVHRPAPEEAKKNQPLLPVRRVNLDDIIHGSERAGADVTEVAAI